MSKNIMNENNQTIINRGIDKFGQFLGNELAQITDLAPNIPDHAYIFHGSYNDPDLTLAEINNATDLLVRMQLGVEDELPVVIIFEYAQSKYRVIDFATDQRKHQAMAWLESFRQESHQAIKYELSH